MKDQNTPTNTLEEKVRDIIFEYGSTNKSVNLGEAKSLIMELISEAVNKARIDEVDRIPIVGHINHLTGRRVDINTRYKADRKAELKTLNQIENKTNTHMEGNEDE